MRKNIFTIAIIAIIFVLSSCEKDETQTKASETNDTGLLSIEYKYSDTIRLSNNEQGYVDIVVSSDKEDVLKSHLSKNEYCLETSETIDYETQVENNQLSPLNSDINTIDIDKLPKIKVDIINQKGINKYGIRCLPKQNSNSSAIQKAKNYPGSNVIVYPNQSYYEYSSQIHKTYGAIKYTYYTRDDVYLPINRVRFGSKDCWLCKVDTWPNGQWGYLNDKNTGYWSYEKNTFGIDGPDYQGYGIYRLYTGVLSMSPNNHFCRWETFSFPDNW